MRLLTCLLFTSILAAQDPAPVQASFLLDLRTDLGADPAAGIQLAPRGCWDGLLLGTTRPVKPVRKGMAEATVEVWELLPPDSPRREAFGLYLGALRERLSKAWLAPLPKHQAIELGEIMANDPSSPQKLDLTKVKSMQERFNQLPPHRSAGK